MLPKSCKMPDLSHLDPLIPGLVTALMGFKGETLTEKERGYVRVFALLAEKAITEYSATRECVVAELEEMQRSAEEMAREGRKLYFLDFDSHMKECLKVTRRLFSTLEFAKRVRDGGLTIDRQLTKRIKRHEKAVSKIRDFDEHIDEKIKNRKTTVPVMLMLSDDDKGVEIAEHSLKFVDLAWLLERFHELARQWLDDFCRKAT